MGLRLSAAKTEIWRGGNRWISAIAALLDRVRVHDEWQVSDRRYLSEGSMALLTATANEVAPAQLLPA
jgi:hypothetical protein